MNHAWCLSQLGRPTEAEREYRAILDARPDALGLDEAKLVKCRGSLGLVLLEQGRPVEAIASFEPAPACRREHLRPGDPLIVGLVGYLAEAYAEAGRDDAARSALEEWLAHADSKDAHRARREALLASLREAAAH